MRLFYTLMCVILIAATRDQAAGQTERNPVIITPLASGVSASFRGLAVRNSHEAWITGSHGTVIRTTNFGSTWQHVKVPDAEELDFRDVEILRDGSVLLMSIGNGGASRLLRSTDSGNTWKTVLVNAEPEGFFDGMAFLPNGRKGVLFGDPIDGRLDMYQTGDGGATWQRFPPQQRPEMKKGEYGFAASGTGIVLSHGNIWIATGGSVARVLHSADDGITWDAYDTPIRSGNESSGIFSIDFIDHKRAVVIGGNYSQPELDRDNVATSVDGGRTWLTLPTVRMPHKACLQSLGGGRLLTCGRTGVAFSADNGRTWKTISTDSYYTLAVDRSSGSGFLAGKNGHIARFELAPAAGASPDKNE
ncbi:MAG: oxidoreductase [Fuerstiella sp.]